MIFKCLIKPREMAREWVTKFCCSLTMLQAMVLPRGQGTPWAALWELEKGQLGYDWQPTVVPALVSMPRARVLPLELTPTDSFKYMGPVHTGSPLTPNRSLWP